MFYFSIKIIEAYKDFYYIEKQILFQIFQLDAYFRPLGALFKCSNITNSTPNFQAQLNFSRSERELICFCTVNTVTRTYRGRSNIISYMLGLGRGGGTVGSDVTLHENCSVFIRCRTMPLGAALAL